MIEDWLATHLTARERAMYRIAMKYSKDPDITDETFFANFVKEHRPIEDEKKRENVE